MISSYQYFSEFAVENLSAREYEIVRSHPNEFRDITFLALLHVKNTKFFKIEPYETSLDAVQPMLHYAERLLSSSTISFLRQNAELAAVAFIFEIGTIISDETI